MPAAAVRSSDSRGLAGARMKARPRPLRSWLRADDCAGPRAHTATAPFEFEPSCMPPTTLNRRHQGLPPPGRPAPFVRPLSVSRPARPAQLSQGGRPRARARDRRQSAFHHPAGTLPFPVRWPPTRAWPRPNLVFSGSTTPSSPPPPRGGPTQLLGPRPRRWPPAPLRAGARPLVPSQLAWRAPAPIAPAPFFAAPLHTLRCTVNFPVCFWSLARMGKLGPPAGGTTVLVCM
jgi:hypothetical protein